MERCGSCNKPLYHCPSCNAVFCNKCDGDGCGTCPECHKRGAGLATEAHVRMASQHVRPFHRY